MKRVIFIGTAILSLLSLTATAQTRRISGDYIETRNAEVWTSACIANGELNLAGDQAIIAWRVNHGEWNGVSLEGLGVVAVVKASATLGDQFNDPYPVKAVLIVDERANAEQQKALVALAQELAGQLVKDVIDVKIAPIKMEMSHHVMHDAKSSLRAGNLVGVETRGVSEKDHFCGNEGVFYAPLTPLVHSMPAVAELDQYDGPGLGVIWTLHGKRSAFVGSFIL